MKADPLIFPLTDFQKEIESIIKRGKATMALMQKSGYSQERINAEELALSREILHLRIKYTAMFGERLTEIIQSCG